MDARGGVRGRLLRAVCLPITFLHPFIRTESAPHTPRSERIVTTQKNHITSFRFAGLRRPLPIGMYSNERNSRLRKQGRSRCVEFPVAFAIVRWRSSRQRPSG